MLNFGKIFRALRDKKKYYSNSCVVRNKFSERNKKPYPPPPPPPPPPIQVKWSVPYCYKDFVLNKTTVFKKIIVKSILCGF